LLEVRGTAIDVVHDGALLLKTEAMSSPTSCSGDGYYRPHDVRICILSIGCETESAGIIIPTLQQTLK